MEIEDYVSIEMLNTLENLVCRKFSYLNRDFSGNSDLWSYPIDQCKRIEESLFSVNTIVKEVLRNFYSTFGDANYRTYHVLLARTYILLYYKHRDESKYQSVVFPVLIPDMGLYGKNYLDEINKKIDEIKDMEDIINGNTKDYPNPVRLELLMRFMDIPEEVRKKSGHNLAMANIMNIITGIPVSTCESYPSKRDLNKDYHREILKTIDEYLVKLKSSILFFPSKGKKEESNNLVDEKD